MVVGLYSEAAATWFLLISSLHIENLLEVPQLGHLTSIFRNCISWNTEQSHKINHSKGRNV